MDGIKVRTASPSYRASPQLCAVYQSTGTLLATATGLVGKEAAFSAVLSRITRELRRELGVAGARAVLQGLADTMEAVSAFDTDL